MKKLYCLIFGLLLVSSAFAAIIHNEVDDLLEQFDDVSYYIQGNNLRIKLNGGWYFDNISIEGNNTITGLIHEGTENDMKRLEEGDMIDQSSTFGAIQQGGYSPTYFPPQFTSDPPIIEDGSIVYFGWRRKVGFEQYYGWVKIEKVSEGEARVLAYAYNDQAFAPIQVGQTDASSVLDASIINRIEIFPNPAQEVLRIKGANNSETINIEILDLQGRIVKSAIMNGRRDFYIGDLKSGNYLIRFGNQSGSFVKE